MPSDKVFTEVLVKADNWLMNGPISRLTAADVHKSAFLFSSLLFCNKAWRVAAFQFIQALICHTVCSVRWSTVFTIHFLTYHQTNQWLHSNDAGFIILMVQSVPSMSFFDFYLEQFCRMSDSIIILFLPPLASAAAPPAALSPRGCYIKTKINIMWNNMWSEPTGL